MLYSKCNLGTMLSNYYSTPNLSSTNYGPLISKSEKPQNNKDNGSSEAEDVLPALALLVSIKTKDTVFL